MNEPLERLVRRSLPVPEGQMDGYRQSPLALRHVAQEN